MIANQGDDYPLVRNAQAGPSEDAMALLVDADTAQGGKVRFALALRDMQNFIAFLVVAAGKIGVPCDGATAAGSGNGSGWPIPATSLAVGETTGEEACVGIGVGAAELVFSLPTAALEALGRSLLTASANVARPM